MDDEDANHYTCAVCGGVFEKGWSDEESAAESVALFGDLPADALMLVCDDCWQKLLAWKNPLDWRAEQAELN